MESMSRSAARCASKPLRTSPRISLSRKDVSARSADEVFRAAPTNTTLPRWRSIRQCPGVEYVARHLLDRTRACLTKVSGGVPEALGMSRFELLSDVQWALIEDLLPMRTGKQGRPFQDARSMVEGIIYRYRCGIAWRDVPEVFGPWQTIWTWHRRMSADGTWDAVLARLLAAADDAGIIDWAVAVDSTIARAHQHATNITRHTGGWVELHESGHRAA